MKKAILILFCISFSMQANAQWWGSEKIKGNGEIVTKKRSVGSYDEVGLTGSMDVELIAGKEGSLEIIAESNLQEYITTEVKGGKLHISTKKDVNLQPTKDIKIVVPFESLDGVSLTGSGDIYNKDVIKSRDFGLSVTGSGDIVLNLDVETANGSVTGSGDVNLKGSAGKLICKVTGSGDFEAGDLRSREVEAMVSGSGDILVNASERLKATISGSGDIRYKGNPQKEDFRTSGSGKVSSY